MQGITAEIEKLVTVAIETGAALSGTLQTENIGVEKIICNVVGNPNIRYIVLCGAEVEGHRAGSAVKALLTNGVTQKRTIIGSQAVTPYLFNISLEAIDRFRKQVTLVDLIGEMAPEVVAKAVWSCYQEKHTAFKDYMIYDPGAYPEVGISVRLSGRVQHPEEVEEWELDDVLKEIEAAERAVIKPEKEVREEMKGLTEPTISFLRRQLLRISEELADLAQLLGKGAEIALPPSPEEKKEAPAIVKEKPVPVEEGPVVLYFKNQLRGFHSVLAGLEACDQDICHGGKTMPLAVGRTIKRLEKFKTELEKVTLPAENKDSLMVRIEEYLKRAGALPQGEGP
jgi:tetrahydromethanopterin S-methyltransferase subunit A